MILFVSALLVVLVVLALRKGYRLPEIAKMGIKSIRPAFVVIGVMFLIGCLTALWRGNGAIAFFITYGVRALPPSLFVLSAFLLSSVMSYAIGTSFGVVATAGVILISIAKAGGVDLVPVAGAIMSGIYVGDRGSPAASSAALVSAVTGTDLTVNIRKMLGTSAVPFLLSAAAYTVMSFFCPMEKAETGIIDKLSGAFELSPFCLLPAVIIVILPLLRVPINVVMLIDVAVSFAVAMAVQGQGFAEVLHTMIFGYSNADPDLEALLSGGGALSMTSIIAILLISGTYSGIIRETGILGKVDSFILGLEKKLGRFPVMALLGIGTASVFCNQTAATIMTNQLGGSMYEDSENGKYEKMLDIEDSVIVISGLVPWCIACSTPLTTMGADIRSLPFAFYLFLIPVCRMVSLAFKKKKN